MDQDRFKTQTTEEAREQERLAALKTSFSRPTQRPLPTRPFATTSPVPNPQPATPAVIVPVTAAPPVQVPQITPAQPQPILPQSPWQRPAVSPTAPPVTPVFLPITPTTVSINISLSNLKVPKVSKEHLDTAKKVTLKLSSAGVAAYLRAKPYIVVAANKARSRALKVPYRRLAPATVGCLVVIMLATTGNYLWNKHADSRIAAATAASTSKLSSNITTKPAFKPVVPASKTELAAGKAGETAFDTKRGTFSYDDSLKGQPVIVSQQPIPSTFKTANDAVTSIAKDLSAKQAVVTSSGVTGYIATDPKSNSQTVVFTVNNLIVFIRSPFTHQQTDWQQYLASLKQQ